MNHQINDNVSMTHLFALINHKLILKLMKFSSFEIILTKPGMKFEDWRIHFLDCTKAKSKKMKNASN